MTQEVDTRSLVVSEEIKATCHGAKTQDEREFAIAGAIAGSRFGILGTASGLAGGYLLGNHLGEKRYNHCVRSHVYEQIAQENPEMQKRFTVHRDAAISCDEEKSERHMITAGAALAAGLRIRGKLALPSGGIAAVLGFKHAENISSVIYQECLKSHAIDTITPEILLRHQSSGTARTP